MRRSIDNVVKTKIIPVIDPREPISRISIHSRTPPAVRLGTGVNRFTPGPPVTPVPRGGSPGVQGRRRGLAGTYPRCCGERARRRMESIGRLNIDDDQALALVNTKMVHIALIVIGLVMMIALHSFNALFLGFAPFFLVGAMVEHVRDRNPAKATCINIGKSVWKFAVGWIFGNYFVADFGILKGFNK
jgi:hypothetical protein|eukprot:COSAG01_NODE_3281_length_6311_cov_20.464907_7_plen_188_part_00